LYVQLLINNYLVRDGEIVIHIDFLNSCIAENMELLN